MHAIRLTKIPNYLIFVTITLFSSLSTHAAKNPTKRNIKFIMAASKFFNISDTNSFETADDFIRIHKTSICEDIEKKLGGDHTDQKVAKVQRQLSSALSREARSKALRTKKKNRRTQIYLDQADILRHQFNRLITSTAKVKIGS